MSRTRQLVADLRRRLGHDNPMAPAPTPTRVPPPPRKIVPVESGGAFKEQASPHTTALLGIGNVGTRYSTEVVLQFQAELAVAHEAVASELPDGWAEGHDLIGLQSRVSDHREYLLRPDLGRRLSDESRTRLRGAVQTRRRCSANFGGRFECGRNHWQWHRATQRDANRMSKARLASGHSSLRKVCPGLA